MRLPTRCLLCALPHPRQDGPVCRGCHQDLPRLRDACPSCGLPLPAGHGGSAHCGRCLRTPPPFHRALIPFRYGFPVDALLRGFKFHGGLAAGAFLGGVLADHLHATLDRRPDLLVPVPLHPRRLRQRGFNQALELARASSRRLGIPLANDVCRRNRATPEQSHLDATQRRRNLRGAFTALRSVDRKHLLIVDDVMTTGTTVSELARVLLRAGAARVDVCCVARASG